MNLFTRFIFWWPQCKADVPGSVQRIAPDMVMVGACQRMRWHLGRHKTGLEMAA